MIENARLFASDSLLYGGGRSQRTTAMHGKLALYHPQYGVIPLSDEIFGKDRSHPPFLSGHGAASCPNHQHRSFWNLPLAVSHSAHGSGSERDPDLVSLPIARTKNRAPPL